MGEISYEQLIELVDESEVKQNLSDLIFKIKDIKRKYGYFNRIIAEISKFRNSMLEGELSISEKEFMIIDKIYNAIDKDANISCVSSRMDEDANIINFNSKYYFSFDQVKNIIIEKLQVFFENNIKDADERRIYKIKVLICATADKFMENLAEMREIDASLYKYYKKKYYELKNSYKKELKIDEELEIENLIDEETEFVQ